MRINTRLAQRVLEQLEAGGSIRDLEDGTDTKISRMLKTFRSERLVTRPGRQYVLTAAGVVVLGALRQLNAALRNPPPAGHDEE